MKPYPHSQVKTPTIYDCEFYYKIRSQFIDQYSLNVKLASEMTWELIEILQSVHEKPEAVIQTSISNSKKLTST